MFAAGLWLVDGEGEDADCSCSRNGLTHNKPRKKSRAQFRNANERFRRILTVRKREGIIVDSLLSRVRSLILVPEQVASLLRRGAILEDAGDVDGAYQCYLEAADMGSIDAMVWLAQTMGENFGQSSPEASAWWKRAAEGGDAEAMCFYGIALASRDDFASAEAWLRKSISNGHEDGFHNLVILKVLQKMDEEAAEIWKMQPASASFDTAADVIDAHCESFQPELADHWLSRIKDFGDADRLRLLADKVGAAYFAKGKSSEAQVVWAQFRAEGEEAPYLDEASGEMVFPLSPEQNEQINELIKNRDPKPQ